MLFRSDDRQAVLTEAFLSDRPAKQVENAQRGWSRPGGITEGATVERAVVEEEVARG